MDHTEALEAFAALLTPITRNRIDHAGPREIVTPVNEHGIDVHVADVTTVAADPDGRAHAYLVIWPSALPATSTRLDGHTHMRKWTVNVTVAGGDYTRCAWALGQVETILARARLSPTTGLITPVFDTATIRVDEDVTPPRHYVPLQYSTNVC